MTTASGKVLEVLQNRFRFWIVLITFLCLTAITSNYSIINFTFICMSKEIEEDGSVNATIAHYAYTASEKSTIIWAVAAGTIIGTFPVNWFYVKFGAKYPFFVAGLLSAVSTAFIPLAAELSWNSLLALRFIQGLSYAADFAAVGLVVVRWAPLDEAGMFISILTCFTPVSSIITNPVSAAFCSSSFGWRWSFYAHAAVCVVLFVIWLVVYDDDPQNHVMVNPAELAVIQNNKTEAHIERDSFVPYMEICSNPTILVVWLNAFAEIVAVTVLLTYAPIFFHDALGFDVTLTGSLVSLAVFIHMPMKCIPAYLSDNVKCYSDHSKMRFFNATALGLGGVMCALIGFIPNSLACVVWFTAVYSVMGAHCGGFYKCATLVSRQYAHFVVACIQFTKCISLFVGPGLVALFVHDEHSIDDWRWVYVSIGAMMFTANLLFYIMCSDQPADFTNITRKTSMQKQGVECGKTAKLSPESYSLPAAKLNH